MGLTQTPVSKRQEVAPYPDCAGDVVAKRFTFSFDSAPSLNDIIEIGVLPATTRVIDMILDSDDLDSNGSPTMTFDVGLMSGDFGDNDASRTCGAEFFSGSNVPQAGGVVRPTLKTAFRTSPVQYDRSIGLKVAAAAATFQAGTVGLTVVYATT